MRAETEREVSRARAGKARINSLADLDGRTRAASKARALVNDLTSDLGRDPSTGQRQLIVRIAICAVVIEDLETRWIGGEAIDFGAYTRLLNTQRRLLATIGLERRARDVTPPTIEEYERRVRERDRAEASA